MARRGEDEAKRGYGMSDTGETTGERERYLIAVSCFGSVSRKLHARNTMQRSFAWPDACRSPAWHTGGACEISRKEQDRGAGTRLHQPFTHVYTWCDAP